MTEQAKRLSYWAFNTPKYRQLRHESRGRAGGEELQLNRLHDHANCNCSSSNNSLIAKAISYLPRRLAGTIERRIQRNQDDQREWVIGVLLCACGASLILFLNIVLTVCAAILSYSRFESQTSTSAVLYKGNCPFTQDCARWLHFLINILSTLMLAASNYCMQCLSSPSRRQVDIAHVRRQWLDIGVGSLKNLKHVRGERLILWILLLVSSLPIHMMFVNPHLYNSWFRPNHSDRYNSAFFNALGTHEYRVLLASADFNFNNTSNENPGDVDCLEQVMDRNISSFYSASHHFEHLNVQRCLDAYAVDFNTDRGTLVVVTKSATMTNESLLMVKTEHDVDYLESLPYDWYSWMCMDIGCSKNSVKNVGDNWAVKAGRISAPGLSATIPSNPPYTFNVTSFESSDFPYSRISGDEQRDYDRLQSFMYTYPDERDLQRFLNNATGWKDSSWAKDVKIHRTSDVCYPPDSEAFPDFAVDHCLSEKVEEKCQLLFSLPICLAVIACNCIKVICMFLTARDGRREILLTVGDALSSFLSRPDPNTNGRCLVSKSDIEHQRFWGPQHITAHISQKPYPGRLRPRKSWMQAASIRYLVSTVTLCLAIILVSGGLLDAGIKTIQNNGSPASFIDLWDLGFGTATSSTTIGTMKGGQFMGSVFLANIPQLIVSTAYFLYNNLLTNMLLAAEYDSYAKQRLPLRVSWPKGLQRSTYYLSLPYRYSIPLQVASALLHWLISQSLFFMAVIPIDLSGNAEPSSQVSLLGFSPVAIIFAIILGGVMVGAILLLGMRRFKSNIPLAGSCSAAISAACHPVWGGEHALRPVMWGEVRKPQANQASLSASDSEEVLCRPESDEDESRANHVQEGSEANLLTERPSDNNVSAHCSFTSYEVVDPHRRRFYA